MKDLVDISLLFHLSTYLGGPCLRLVEHLHSFPLLQPKSALSILLWGGGIDKLNASAAPTDRTRRSWMASEECKAQSWDNFMVHMVKN